MNQDYFMTTKHLITDSRKFIIPLYQREYKWGTKQIDQFLEDLDQIKYKKLSDNKYKVTPHFMGLLVFVNDESSDELHVVDGQQRLTTITLFAKALHDFADAYEVDDSSFNKHELIDNLNSLLLNSSTDLGEKDYKLHPNINDKQLFNLLVKGRHHINDIYSVLIDKDKKLVRKSYYKTYDSFIRHFEDNYLLNGKIVKKDLVLSYYKLIDGLSFIRFIVNNEEDAFNLFETLNDRGLSLSALDLIKNKALQKSENKTYVEEVWGEIFGKTALVPPSKGQLFIRNYLMAATGHVSNREIYSTAKSLIDNNSKAFLKEVLSYAKLWNNIHSVDNPNNPHETIITDNQLIQIIYMLKLVNVRQWYSLGLIVLKLYTEEIIGSKQVLSLFDNLLILFVRFRLMDKKFNLLEKKIPTLANSVYNKLKGNGTDQDNTNVGDLQFDDVQDSYNYIKNQLQHLIDKHVPDESFHSYLDNDPLVPENDLATLLLRRIIIKEKGLQHGLILGFDLTLEHVYPIKSDKYWERSTDLEDEHLKYSIGNMLLLEQAINSSVSNRKLEDKSNTYKEIDVIDYFKDKELSVFNFNSNTWLTEGIAKRESKLIELIKKAI